MSKKSIAILISIVLAIAIFLSLYFEISVILNSTLNFKNILAFIILSLVLGLFAFIFYNFRQKFSFIIYIIGLFSSFITMHNIFRAPANGWNGLIGILSFTLMLGAITALAFLVQLIYFIYKHTTQKQEKLLDDITGIKK